MNLEFLPETNLEESTKTTSEYIYGYLKGEVNIFDLQHATKDVERDLLATLFPRPEDLEGEEAFRCVEAIIILFPPTEDEQ
jgi:hypothetical protein